MALTELPAILMDIEKYYQEVLTVKINHPIIIAALIGLLLVLASSPLAAAEDPKPTGTSARDSGSLESKIERRRDQLRRLRENQRDLYTGRRWRQPPWVNAHKDWMDQRENQMKERFQHYRDQAEARRNAMGRWINPWSQWRQDLIKAQRNARELERLDRVEHQYYYWPRTGARAHYWRY